ncbi:hypothetical protein HGM15179_007381, partial [Zosterops borbonicus]
GTEPRQETPVLRLGAQGQAAPVTVSLRVLHQHQLSLGQGAASTGQLCPPQPCLPFIKPLACLPSPMA